MASPVDTRIERGVLHERLMARPSGTGLAHERAFLLTGGFLFVASAVGTIHLCGSMSSGMPMPGGWDHVDGMDEDARTDLAGLGGFVHGHVDCDDGGDDAAISLPMLLNYRRSVPGPANTRRRALPVIAGAGYFFVGALFGAVTYPFGVVLATAEMRWSNLARFVPIATGMVLLLAGCIQVTRWKARQLEHCRNAPAPGQSQPSDAWSAWRHGLHLGVQCALCCTAFMIILLAAGVMNLGNMALLTAAITTERLAPWPKGAALIIGFIMITIAAFAIARALSVA